ncbi:MAG: Crp/Fnr family transcriptional regulator [Litorimonas sp.]
MPAQSMVPAQTEDDAMERSTDTALMPSEQISETQCGTRNCLIDKLSHYLDLDDAEVSAVHAMQSMERRFERDEVVFSATDHNQDLYIVQEGWLFNYIDTPDGRRQIVNIYHPGDMIGFPDVALPERTTSLFAVEQGSLCPFPKEGLGSIFKSCPRLAALLLTIALREETILIDRLRIFSRMSAQARVGYLFLELNARLNVGSSTTNGHFHMPLNQQEIGDAVGLTNVSVSRAISALEGAGIIATASKSVTLLNLPALVGLCDFKDRYASMQTEWFPLS